MVRDGGEVLYVGKAQSLRKRVSSYFRNKGGHGEHILEMLCQVKDILVRPAATALEAALLEHDEIKRLAPPYNRALQSANRAIAFYPADLTAASPRCSPRFPIGPIPGSDTLCVLPHIARMLNDGVGELSAAQELQLPPQYAPDREILRQGLALFREKHVLYIRESADVRGLLDIGHALWGERIAAGANPPDAEETDAGEQAASAPAEFVWTGEAALHLLESTVLRCGMYLRRARLFRQLSQATIVWPTPDGRRRNLLVIAGGAVHTVGALDAGRDIPPPPGAAKRFKSRGTCFDLATYDRLRVLTTELRRLVNDGRQVQVRTARAARLDCAGLKALLSWM
jgi:DNA polymerase-3 subunit epsilon